MQTTAFLAALAIAASLASAHAETCIASQYGVGDGYHGKPVACAGYGRFNTYARDPFTVAHKDRRRFPCGSKMRITSLDNGRAIVAVVTDRGPFIAGRCVDVGRAGAEALGMGGLARVRVERID